MTYRDINQLVHDYNDLKLKFELSNAEMVKFKAAQVAADEALKNAHAAAQMALTAAQFAEDKIHDEANIKALASVTQALANTEAALLKARTAMNAAIEKREWHPLSSQNIVTS